MNSIKCDLCNKDYKYGSYERHLTSKTHLFNVYENEHKHRKQEEKEQPLYTVEEKEYINKYEVIDTITHFYNLYNNRLEYPDGEKLKMLKIKSIKKFINNLMKDERNYKDAFK